VHWLFDYDLTLYGDEERHILTALDRNISRFLVVRFGISETEADQLRRQYWQHHGTTLNGLRAHYGIEPDEYFDFIHQGESLPLPVFSQKKRELLLRLPGRRWVFTNARRDWAERGLESMGIRDCFEGIFDISTFDWESKPSLCVYHEVERRIGASSDALVLLDDSTANLTTANRCGWQTVLVHPNSVNDPGDWNLKIRHILELDDVWSTLVP
jgi:putative hydrolase of the HAD superfamily